MADDQLRMQAVITDGFTAPLAKLKNELRSVGKEQTGRQMALDFKAVGKSLDGVVQTMKTGLAPVMRGIGVASLGLGAAVTGAIVGLKNFASSTRDLQLFSHQVGISVDKLREIKTLGEFFGMSWETAQTSLKSFAGNLDQLRRHWGTAYNELRGMNLAGLAEELAKAPDMSTAVEKAIEGIRKIQNPVRRREVAELLFGTDQWAVIAAEAGPKVRKTIEDMLKNMPAGSAAAAEEFALNMLKIKLSLENLKVEGFDKLLPEVDRFINLMTKGAGGGAGALITFAHDLAAALKEIDDVIEHLSKGEKRKAFDDIFKIKPGSIADSVINGGLGGSQDNLARDQDRLTQLDSEIAASKKNGFNTGLLEMQRKLLIEEMAKLRKAIEDANRNALLNKSSFVGGGIGGGGGVINAMYSGGGAARGGGYSGGEYGGTISRGTGDASAGRTGPGFATDAPWLPNGGIDRSRFLDYFRRHPEMKDRLFRHSLGENGDPVANQAVMEEWANRGDIRGYGDAGLSGPNMRYFQGYFRGTITAKMRKMLEENFKKVFEEGSDVSAGAIDNSSSWLAAKHERNGRFRTTRTYHGEHFQIPGWGESGSGERDHYAQWRRQQLDRARARSATTPTPTPAPAEIRGSAKIDIHLHGLPGGSKVRSQFDGMFQDINIHRGRPMQSVWEA